MDRTRTFPIRRFSSLDDMKAEEYRYWQRRPVHERMQAVTEISMEAYRLKNASDDAPRLQRTLVRLER